jgi:hypothetical protein
MAPPATGNHRSRWLWGALLLLVCAGLWLALERQRLHDAAQLDAAQLAHARQQQLDAQAALRARLAETLPGTAMLKNYGTVANSPQADLTDLSHVLGNFSLLMKGANPMPLGANEDIANALRGRNRQELRFIPDQHPVLNAQGQLIDRWGSALYFHAIDANRLDIRCAGPDRQMWTADDIHRRYDGQFVKGEALNDPSLFEATKDYRGN